MGIRVALWASLGALWVAVGFVLIVWFVMSLYTLMTGQSPLLGQPEPTNISAIMLGLVACAALLWASPIVLAIVLFIRKRRGGG